MSSSVRGSAVARRYGRHGRRPLAARACSLADAGLRYTRPPRYTGRPGRSKNRHVCSQLPDNSGLMLF